MPASSNHASRSLDTENGISKESKEASLRQFNMAIENGPFIVDFPINHVDFP